MNTFVCCAALCVLSSFATISLRKRELVVFLMSCGTVLLVGMQYVIVSFPGHTHLMSSSVCFDTVNVGRFIEYVNMVNASQYYYPYFFSKHQVHIQCRTG